MSGVSVPGKIRWYLGMPAYTCVKTWHTRTRTPLPEIQLHLSILHQATCIPVSCLPPPVSCQVVMRLSKPLEETSLDLFAKICKVCCCSNCSYGTKFFIADTYNRSPPKFPLLMTEVELNIQPSLGGFGKLPACEHHAFVIRKHEEALASIPGAEHAVACVLCVNPQFWRQYETGPGVP